MNWIGLLIFVVVVGGLWLLRRGRRVTEKVACELLQKGALVVDVRTAPEFAQGHLPQAINMPLNEITQDMPKRVPDRNQALLLHCQIGLRSEIARKKLRALGYGNAHSLGDYARAERILSKP